jgi:plasmid stabilization system protein ParE
MTPIRLLKEAEEELRAAAEFYEAEQAGPGKALIQEVRRACDLVAEPPSAGRVERNDIRVRTIAWFPYRIE